MGTAAVFALVLGLGTAMGADAPPTPTLKAPPFTVDVRVTPQQVLEFKARPPASHHFNADAPIAGSAEGGKALTVTSKTETDVRFHGPLPSQSSDYTFAIYLCDDTKTFCEKHTLSGRWTMPAAGSSAALAGDWSSLPLTAGTAAAPIAEANDGPHGKKDSFGFILNDADAALAEAKASGKPLLVDFFGIWCPPCNELDEEVFGSPEFKKASAGFVLLKLDVDTSSSWTLKGRYKIAGYPTIILAAPDGDEITRIVGSRPRPEMVRLVKQAYESRNEPFQVLKARADSGDAKASGKIGLVYLDRKEYEPAVAYLAKDSSSNGEALSAAKIGALESQGGAPLIAAYEASLRDYPKTPESIERRSKLADLYASVKPQDWETKQRTLLTELVKVGKELVKHPARLATHDAAAGDIWESIASAQETLGDPDAKKSWLAGAKAYAAKIHSDKERGNNLELAFCLWNGGDTAGAEKIYSKLEKYYPTEFTYYFSHARMAFHLKRLDSAKELAAQAYAHSYGDNRLRVAKLYAEVLDAHGDRKAALSLIKDTLASADIPSDPSIRTHRYADDLKSLQAKLQ